MIELRTLGSLDLRAADGAAVGSVLAQPKRLALLVFLVLEAPGGFVRRDTLLATFWPESNDERARAALRQSVRYLRRSLGEAAIVNRAEDEIGVAEGALRCDVVELRRMLDTGELERAVGGYAGELLPGFHVDDAPEFERWLNGQRSALRTDVAAAAAALADRAAAGGELDEALRCARHVSAMLPLDEAALRRVVGLLDRIGERAGAVAAYREFERRLAAELEMEPSPETRAMVERICTGEAIRPAAVENARVVVAADGAPRPFVAEGVDHEPLAVPAPAPAADPASDASARRPSRAKWWRGAAAGLVAGGLVVAAGFVYTSRSSPAPPLNVSRVLVATFQNQTLDPDLDAVGRMAADWIIEGISRTGRFEVVPSTAVWAVERHLAEAGPLPTVALHRQLAHETGSGVVVAGSFYREAGRLYFRAHLLDAASGRVLYPVDPVSAHPDSLVQGIDRLRGRVLAALAPVGDTVYHLRMAAAPPSYEAYQEALAGMDAFVVGNDPATALRRFERAAAADPAYPHPRLAAAIMHLNLGNLSAGDSIAADVAAARDFLGPLERHTLDFVLARLRADHRMAYDAMSRAAGIAPGTINEYMIAEQARILNRPREAIRVLRALGPERGELRGWRAYWREMVWAHLMLDDVRGALREAGRARGLYPNDPLVLSLEVQALAARGRVAEVDVRIEERLASASAAWPSPGILMHLAARELDAQGHREAAARMLERGIAWLEALPADTRAEPLQRFHYATALRHAGRLEEARTLLAKLVEEHPDDPSYVGGLGLVQARLGDRGEAERNAARLEEFGPVLGRSGPINRTRGEHTYLRAAIAAQLDELDHAVDLLRRAESEGMQRGPHLRSDPDLAPLRSHPAFREWLRPKG